MLILMCIFLRILKLEENIRTKFSFQLQNLEKKFRVGGKKLGYVPMKWRVKLHCVYVTNKHLVHQLMLLLFSVLTTLLKIS